VSSTYSSMSLIQFFREINRLRMRTYSETDPAKKAAIERRIDFLLDQKNEELLRQIMEVLDRINEKFELEIFQINS
jgi:hypothetical protein